MVIFPSYVSYRRVHEVCVTRIHATILQYRRVTSSLLSFSNSFSRSSAPSRPRMSRRAVSGDGSPMADQTVCFYSTNYSIEFFDHRQPASCPEKEKQHQNSADVFVWYLWVADPLGPLTFYVRVVLLNNQSYGSFKFHGLVYH